MVRAQERGLEDGWDIRAIYEPLTQHDIMETEAFFMAFAKLHNIDGHKVMSVLAKARHQPLPQDGMSRKVSILIVSDTDMQGMRISDSLRVDGDLFTITGISHPCGDIVRLELEGNTPC